MASISSVMGSAARTSDSESQRGIVGHFSSARGCGGSGKCLKVALKGL
jgi:hypothetical protein